MSNTAKIQASTANPPAVDLTLISNEGDGIPCMLAGQDHQARVTFDPKQISEPVAFTTDGAREHAETDSKTVTVMLRPGQLEDDGSQLVLWSHLKGGKYDIEAAYDDRTISRADAETRLRADLADQGMQVTTFLQHADGQPGGIDPGKVTAAVHEAMRKTFPNDYTPALANAIAADTIARLSQAAEPETDTAALAGLSIVPALVDGVQVAVACPAAWCTENHTGENTGHLGDVSHTGASVDLYAPSFRGGFDDLFAYAHLTQDLYSKNPKERAAHIRVEDGGGEESPLTPDQADAFAGNLTVFAGQIRALARVARQAAEPVTKSNSAATPTACPGGITWCLGEPANHADPREHRHEGPEYGLTGSYVDGNWTKSLVAFQIAQWDGGEPRLVFQSDGTWPDLGLSGVDELIGDAVPWLVQLFATRRRLAIELSPNRSKVPFAESEDKQTASAGFDLATKAIDVALARAEGRAGMFRALRNFLDLTEDELA